MEGTENGYRVWVHLSTHRVILITRLLSRSQASKGRKTQWEERMERTKREKAMKKLENELKEEKQAEKQRWVLSSPPFTSDSFLVQAKTDYYGAQESCGRTSQTGRRQGEGRHCASLSSSPLQFP